MFLLLLCLAGFPARAQEQPARLSGRIFIAGTGEPLPGVNVYLSGTTIGSASDADGRFAFERIPPGSYEVVASMVGFSRSSVQHRFLPGAVDTVSFSLTEQVVELDVATVRGETPRDWKRLLRLFEERFLGPSENASKCRLVNPEVLVISFDPRRDLLEARSLQPLQIENRALGYLVTVDIERFAAEGERMSWSGFLKFEELPTDSRRTRRSWDRSRREAYDGSFRHFLVSLDAGKLASNGFDAVAVIVPGGGLARAREGVHLDTWIQPGDYPFERRLWGPVVIRVVYSKSPDSGYMRKETAQRDVYRSTRLGSFWGGLPLQESWVEVTRIEAVVDLAGRSRVEGSVVSYGYWAWKRFSDELPLDYRPEP